MQFIKDKIIKGSQYRFRLTVVAGTRSSQFRSLIYESVVHIYAT
jgi:DNA-directed RNA polymerase subunit K/omega